jgi:hypothetical protein
MNSIVFILLTLVLQTLFELKELEVRHGTIQLIFSKHLLILLHHFLAIKRWQKNSFVVGYKSIDGFMMEFINNI